MLVLRVAKRKWKDTKQQPAARGYMVWKEGRTVGKCDRWADNGQIMGRV